MNKLLTGKFRLVKTLGEGAFGEVHLWKNDNTGEEIATKRLKANAKLKPDEMDILQKRWLQECKWLQNLQTRHIVRGLSIMDQEFLQQLAGPNHIEHSLPVIIMEYCNGGDLRTNLNQVANVNGLTEYEVRNILYALLSAVQYLHDQLNIEHRDIKPENIVSHVQGNERIYKLTDFGYAREIPEYTIAQSVVGTRNYVAPEVIDPGIYTRTVDYWSIGTVAYEILCGTHPFIPHQTFVNRMRNIQIKPQQCIAIVQNVEDPNKEDFLFINNLSIQNRSSTIFNNCMEKWLRLALDNNYKTRGCNTNNEFKLFTDFDQILRKKVVSVFSLKTYKKYYYDIETFSSMHKFFEKIAVDNQIDLHNLFVIYPPLHPHKNPQTPLDYYVPSWCDTSNSDNPPVMLFVGEFLIKIQFDINEEDHFAHLTDAIRACIGLDANEANIPVWLLKQFEKDIHFILSNEQHLLECYMMGLHNYIIEIEYQLFIFKDNMDMLMKKSSELSGSVKHANIVLNEFINIQNGQITNSSHKNSNLLTLKIQQLESKVPMLRDIYTKTLQNVRELASCQLYEKETKKDIFQLLKYRKHLASDYTGAERLANAQSAFENCMEAFRQFKNSLEWYTVRKKINQQLQEFNQLRIMLCNIFNEIEHLENEVNEYTRSLIRQAMNDTTLPMAINSLHLDGASRHVSLAAFDSETPELLNDFQSILNDMETSMNLE